MDNASHPLHTVISAQRSKFSARLLLPSKTNRLKDSFCPTSHQTVQLCTHTVALWNFLTDTFTDTGCEIVCLVCALLPFIVFYTFFILIVLIFNILFLFSFVLDCTLYLPYVPFLWCCVVPGKPISQRELFQGINKV